MLWDGGDGIRGNGGRMRSIHRCAIDDLGDLYHVRDVQHQLKQNVHKSKSVLINDMIFGIKKENLKNT